MGVSIEIWRARIGSFHGKNSISSSQRPTPFSCKLLAVFHFIIVCILLIIGNVEQNPGPAFNVYVCTVCQFKAKTTGQHIKHQQVHVGTFNFRFSCPLPTCHSTFDSFNGVNSHVSLHSIPRNQVTGAIESIKCTLCDKRTATLCAMCQHLKEHLKLGQQAKCPLPKCNREAPFSTANSFSVHLSLYHPGWRTEFDTPEEVGVSFREEEGEEAPVVVEAEEDPQSANMDVDENEDGDSEYEYYDDDVDSDDGSDIDDGQENFFTDDQIFMFIANVYAMLEGERHVPELVVDELARRMAFISEVLQDRLKEQLEKVLTSQGLSQDLISRATRGVLSSDPFYNSHHKNAPGDCFISKHMRKEFYKKKFKYVAPTEINLKKNAHDREETIQYVDIKETVKTFLEDPSVQREIDESFERDFSDTSVISDYPSGSVFRDSNNPKKRIDLLLFLDAFLCVNPLGSAKNDPKYKINGMYMTLGNLRPHLRSFLKSIRLVLLFADSLIKGDDKYSNKRFKRVFKRVMDDLLYLEEHGIEYKGEMIPFRLQFLQGDNLGQHTIGGFGEGFTAIYFCRFCDITKEKFKQDRLKDRPIFHGGRWRDHASYTEALRLKRRGNFDSYHGIKRKSPLNKLQRFKVCDPRLSPCIAHDLFITGVVDCDLSSMISILVQDDEWLSYSDLRNRIKRFKYLGNDKRNKPGHLNDSGRKLGGHAIQNWTLLRMLPYVMENKIQPDNETWKLYLLLKLICEYVCAPKLSVNQIEHLRFLQKEYMMKRKILPNNYKPKHHFFWHYPDLFLKFGALIYHWTMAFEHRHQFFKKVARTCQNFINLGHTLASKFQLLQAYLNMGELFPSKPVCKKAFPLVAEAYEGDLQEYVRGRNFSADTLDVECLTTDHVTYKKGQWLLLEKAPNSNDIVVGQIEVLLCEGTECKAVVSKYCAKLWPDYGIYKIAVSNPVLDVVVFDGSLESPCPHPVYMFKNKLTFSLKNVFLNML